PLDIRPGNTKEVFAPDHAACPCPEQRRAGARRTHRKLGIVQSRERPWVNHSVGHTPASLPAIRRCISFLFGSCTVHGVAMIRHLNETNLGHVENRKKARAHPAHQLTMLPLPPDRMRLVWYCGRASEHDYFCPILQFANSPTIRLGTDDQSQAASAGDA